MICWTAVEDFCIEILWDQIQSIISEASLIFPEKQSKEKLPIVLIFYLPVSREKLNLHYTFNPIREEDAQFTNPISLLPLNN